MEHILQAIDDTRYCLQHAIQAVSPAWSDSLWSEYQGLQAELRMAEGIYLGIVLAAKRLAEVDVLQSIAREGN